MMSRNNRESEKGFTFLELIVCFGILLMIVVPVCSQFMQGLNQRFTVNSMTQATAYGEKLLQDVKAQITNDIKLRNDILGSKKAVVNATDEKGISDYLIGSTSKPAQPLTAFLQSRDNASMNESYDTDKFTYEVGIWNMDDLNVSVSGNKFTLNDTVLNSSARFYTDINYPFDPASYTSVGMPVTFEVTNLDIFNKNKLPDHILNKHVIKFPLSSSTTVENINETSDVIITQSAGNKTEVKCEAILDAGRGGESGFVFKIEDKHLMPTDKDKTGVIEIDVRNLQRKARQEGTNTVYDRDNKYRTLSFKVINNSECNYIVRLKKNTVPGENEYQNNDLFNIVIEDTAEGKTSIAKSEDKEYQQDYLITMIIREKSPVQGQPGKIVKKMIDTYSYDATNN